MTADELLAIRGTAAFDEEFGRQAVALAEHHRKHPEELIEPDWEWLDKVWIWHEDWQVFANRLDGTKG